MIGEFIIIIGLLGLIFASLADIKTREVPNWLSYSLIAIGLSCRLVWSILTMQWMVFIYGLIGFGVFFIIGCLMYYGKQWGGGDSKILMGLGALFGNLPENIFFNYAGSLPFILALFLNVLVCGSLYGLCWMLCLTVKNRKIICDKISRKDLFAVFFFGAIFFILFSLLINLFFGIFIGTSASIVYLIFRINKILEKYCMYKKVSVNSLVEGDWLYRNIIVNNKVVISSKILGLKKNDIEKIKKLRIKYVLVKEGIPFIPSFLIALILSLVIGNIFLF